MKPLGLIYSRNPFFLNSVSETAITGGLVVSSASSEEEAKLRINLYPPHIIIIDFESGGNFYDALKASRRLELIPVLMLAEKDKVQDARKVIKGRIGEALPKPLNVKDLTVRAESLINMSAKKFPLHVAADNLRNRKAVIKVTGKLTELSEVGCVISSNVKVDSLCSTKLKSKFFIELGFEPPFSLLYQKYAGIQSSFGAAFVGLGEDELVRIRSWINKKVTKAV